ncbi:MAG: DUF5074 domain-containing protein [Rikenellaceae bacterium]
MKTNFLKRGILLLSLFSAFFITACSDDDTEIEEITVSSDNLEDLDVLVGETYNFSIDVEEVDADEDLFGLAVRWYLDGTLVQTGLSYDFTASEEGTYVLKYIILEDYSTTDEEVTKTVTLEAIDNVAEDDKFNIVQDNLYYSETQLSVVKSYWVNFEDEVSDEIATKGLRWYVNDELAGTGASFDFSPSTEGTYTIKYAVRSHYSSTGAEITKEAEVVTYTSEGIFILSEPNYTGSETIRGINSHTFKSSTVERFIVGDYTTFGATNQCIVNWAGKLYNVATSAGSGVYFSQFNASTGACTGTVASFSQSGTTCRAFSGITPELGVLATSKGAYFVNLSDFTIDETAINGTDAGAYDTFVADGYLFIRVGTSAYAYELDGLSTTSEYVELGTTKSGFIQSKDGSVWGASDSDLIKVSTRDLSVETVNLGDGGSVFTESWSWKPTAWVASTRENAFFYTVSSNGWSAAEVAKYDIDSAVATRNFVSPADDMDGYSLYGTSIYYDSERDELVCLGTVGYTAYNGLFFFDAQTSIKSYTTLYDTADTEIYGTKDLYFPCMISPMKSY